MKKFSKILLGAILSVTMAVTGVLAFNNMQNAYAQSYAYVDGYGDIYGSAGTSVEHGTFAQANIAAGETKTINKTSVSGVQEFTGVKLTGKNGSTFNLGTIDISKSAWAGDKNSVKAGNNASFLEFVYQPAKHDTLVAELQNAIFTISDVNDPTNYISVNVLGNNFYDVWHELSIRAVANKATKSDGTVKAQSLGAYRYNYGQWKSPRKGQIFAADAANLGLENKQYAVTSVGAQSAPVMLYYDYEDKALYSPVVSDVLGATADLAKSYLIRDFDEDTTDALNENNYPNDGVWGGFSSNYVNVSCKFETLLNGVSETSIVITKLGDTSFTSGQTFDEDNVISGATAYSGSAKFGAYPQLTTSKIYKGIKLTGGVGDKFDLGTMSINDTYFDDSWTYVKGQHVYNNFTDYNGAFYTGSDQAFTGAPADSRSFISFALDPSVLSDYAYGTHKVLFKITLTEVGKPENFVTYHVSLHNSNDDKRFEALITCTATNNTYNTAERYRSTGITFNETVRRVVDMNGSQSEEVKLYYDWSQQAAYTNVAFISKGDGIGAAFRIRDFNDFGVTANNGNYASTNYKTINNWSGFSENANVRITLEMTNLANPTADNGIVITSLGGYSFADAELTTLPELNVVAGEQTDLASALIFKSQTVEYKANTSILDSLTYKVNGNEVARNVILNGGETVTIYNGNEQVGGNVTVNANSFTVNAGFNYGSYKVFNADVEDTDGVYEIGSELRVYPGNETVSDLLLSDIRSMHFNDVNYYFDPENPNVGLPFTPVMNGDKVAYYARTITASDLVLNNQLNVDFVFDRYCDVTVVDTAKDAGEQEEITYHWALDGQFDFTMPTAFNGTEIARGSSTDKVLVGYARTDVGYKDASGNFVNLRQGDYKVADYKVAGSFVHYSTRGLGNIYYLRSEIKSQKTVASLVPGIRFETVYVKLWIDVELKLPSAYDLNHAGLRFVVKFDKADVDNYNKYQFVDVSKNPFGTIHNYITTQAELDGGGAGKALDKIGSANWLGSGWNSDTVANPLGLINATGKTKAEMEGKYGYLYEDFAHQEDIWHYAYANENYYAYAITVTFNAKNDKQYVFMPIINLREVFGSATTTMVNAVTASPSSIATTKLADILKDERNGETYAMQDNNGVTYYSNYSVEDINWLATVAGDARTFSLLGA